MAARAGADDVGCSIETLKTASKPRGAQLAIRSVTRWIEAARSPLVTDSSLDRKLTSFRMLSMPNTVKTLRGSQSVMFILVFAMILWVLYSDRSSATRRFGDNLHVIGVASSLVERGCLDPSRQRLHEHVANTFLHNTALVCKESLVSIDREHMLTQRLGDRASESLFDLYGRKVISQDGRMINGFPETVSEYQVNVDIGDRVT